MTTDTSERGLERLICTALTGAPCDPEAAPTESVGERPAAYGAGWTCGHPERYDREYCVDLAQLSAFLREAQPEVTEALDLGQVDFKGKAKAFLRAYGFLSSILPRTKAEWEKLSIFLTFLVPKLPAPVEEDLSKGILEAIDMDSYRVEKRAAMKILLPDADAEIEPVPAAGGGHKPEPELDPLRMIASTGQSPELHQ